MSPLTLTEAFEENPSALYSLIQNSSGVSEYLTLFCSKISLRQQHHYWLQGGYPELWVKSSERFTMLTV